jgi:hypothetical protein
MVENRERNKNRRTKSGDLRLFKKGGSLLKEVLQDP